MVFSTDWNTKHGRIFFRVKVGNNYMENINTMRVHCSYPDMRSVEKLKQIIESIKLPISHENISLAEDILNSISPIYTKGHSLHFMLKHHEYDTNDINNLFSRLKSNIEKGEFYESQTIVSLILEQIKEKEDLFYQIDVNIEQNQISINITDIINNYLFYDDMDIEVYIKEYKEPNSEKIMDNMQTIARDHSQMDPSKHIDLLKPEKIELISEAIKLENIKNKFSGPFYYDWKELEIIVLYGANQNYYFTKRLVLN